MSEAAASAPRRRPDLLDDGVRAAYGLSTEQAHSLRQARIGHCWWAAVSQVSMSSLNRRTCGASRIRRG
ncbi:hypothetical protein AB0903_24715 [Streptomyces sp. NPDC048389]|uniref:hypothetical protein n=1 Tax=Streptomyces sp. NPDC048389 TaxID=3154622 RepID=UPI0034568AD4